VGSGNKTENMSLSEYCEYITKLRVFCRCDAERDQVMVMWGVNLVWIWCGSGVRIVELERRF
jgi:hypothetical protein